MANASEFISSIAAIIWPLLVIAVLIIFRHHIKSFFDLIMDAAKHRNVTLKIAGFELSLSEYVEQQQKLTTDLVSHSLGMTTEDIQAVSILWVDDQPKNNVVEIGLLNQLNAVVTTAVSTNEGLQLFRSRKFDRVISDMGRMEASSFNDTAGLDLVRAIREIDPAVPIIIYCGFDSAKIYAQGAIEAGANYITHNTAELIQILNLS